MADSDNPERMPDERDLVMRDFDRLRALMFAPGIRVPTVEQPRPPLMNSRNRNQRGKKS